MSPYQNSDEKHWRVYDLTFRLLPFMAVLTFAAFVLAAWSIATRDNKADKTHKALCGVIRVAKQNTVTSLRTNPAQLARAQRFYKDALKIADCG